MKLLTVIVNYRTAEMTLKATASAIEAMHQLAGDWQITIVDNDSNDHSFEHIRDAIADNQEKPGWDRVKLTASGHNGGFGAGNNAGMLKKLNSDTPPDYIYILNSDAFPAPNAVTELTNYLDANPQTGIVGSYIHGTDGSPHETAFRFPSIYSEFEDAVGLGIITRLLSKHVVPLTMPETTQAVDWLAGASMMLRSSMLKEVGLFDETFFLYFEETDLCRRAKLKGWDTVYVKSSEVAHIGSVSTGMKEWQRIPTYWLDSRRHYFSKNHGRIYYNLCTMVRLVGELSWQIRRRLQKKADCSPPGFMGDLFFHWIKGF